MHAKLSDDREEISIGLNNEMLAAVAGWREANGLPSNADAISELVRLGLLSEISKVHEFVTAIRSATHCDRDEVSGAVAH